MSFSRLQLAAALIEYDNDNPDARHPPRKASESVIFSNLRARPRPVQASTSRRTDVGQTTPVDERPSSSPSSLYEDRPRILSEQAPPRRERRTSGLSYSTSMYDETPDAITSRYGPIGEVDLASWGLPEDLLGDKSPLQPSIKSAPSSASPALKAKTPTGSIMDRPRSLYASSLMNMDVPSTDHQAATGEIETLSPSVEQAIMGAPPAMETLRRPALAGKRNEGRTVSFGDYDAVVEASVRARYMAGPGEATEMLMDSEEYHKPVDRPRSSSGVMSRGRPTSPFRDVAAEAAVERDSYGSAGTPRPSSVISHKHFAEAQTDAHSSSTDEDIVNPFALPAPGGPRLSRFDPKAAGEAGPPSRGSVLGTTSLHEDRQLPGNSSRMSSMLLRPRTLIMPVPLQSLVDPSASAPPQHLARGFQQGAKPLPPGALTRPDSFIGSLPSSTLTSSQKIFSSSLAVDGQRDDGFIGGADQDGEIGLGAIGGMADEDGNRYGEEEWRPTRNVEGISLVDRLEARKAELKEKKRVFQGDARPSMMARASWHAGMDDPGPVTGADASVSPRSANRLSLAKPLLAFDSAEALPTTNSLSPTATARLSKSRSVFGVDILWEREMKKVRELEEAERQAKEDVENKEQAKRERKENRKKQRKLKGKDKELMLEPNTKQMGSAEDEAQPPPRRSSIDLLRATGPSLDVQDWVASSDEEGRTPRQSRPKTRRIPRRVGSDSDSDEPLSRIRERQLSISVVPSKPMEIAEKAESESSSEDDEPLAQIVKTRSRIDASASVDASPDLEDDDDVPLALRRMTIASRSALAMPPPEDSEEDDVPLGLKHNAAAVQQQQRQSMAMAHQQQIEMMQRQSMFSMPGMSAMPTFSPMGMPGMPGLNMGGMGFPGMPFMGMVNPGFGASMASLPGMPSVLDPNIDKWRRQVEPKEGSVFSERTSGSRMSAMRSDVGM